MKKLYALAACLLGMSAIGIAQCTITSTTITPSGLTINVTATGTGAAFPGYGWDWGDATTPAYTQTTSHTYTAPGTYNVCAYYVDLTDTSCMDTDCQNVTVTAVGIAEASDNGNNISATPNPFGTTTTFGVQLATTSNVEITVYDVTGQKVETIQEGNMAAGNHNIVWTPNNLAGGVYFVQMIVDGNVTTKRIVHTSNQ